MAAPKEGVIDRIHHTSFARIFKAPLLLAGLVNLTPPSESHEESACDVLDHPKIERAEYDDNDEGSDIGDKIAN